MEDISARKQNPRKCHLGNVLRSVEFGRISSKASIHSLLISTKQLEDAHHSLKALFKSLKSVEAQIQSNAGSEKIRICYVESDIRDQWKAIFKEMMSE